MRRPKVVVYRCADCGDPIGATAADPVVAAPSLGSGIYHAACADRIWAAQRTAAEQLAAARHARRSEAAKRLHARRAALAD